MISLSHYISNATKIDGHIHLFDHTGILKSIPEADKVIGFMDIDIDNLDAYEHNDVIGYYDNYIQNAYNNNVTLLATGKDVQTMIDLYNKYPTVIKGFGELKCYSRYKTHKNLPWGNLTWFDELCKFNEDKKLPIFIHWYVFNKSRQEQLHQLLLKYPTIPFVLCHCGMSPFRNYKRQYAYVCDLLLKHNNLYVDISYKPLTFFVKHPEYAHTLINKCIIGTDLNIKAVENESGKKYIDSFNKLNNMSLNYEITVKKIFNTI